MILSPYNHWFDDLELWWDIYHDSYIYDVIGRNKVQIDEYENTLVLD